ncbi:MAG: prepilin-type N-terminal cleavage/methylation domain-containing protein [Kiritimatiellae bacterium]|nr:prepilin-type N-terminal cleavage/methylation domain-containing protein [Kiritimatiellia bacterium]
MKTQPSNAAAFTLSEVLVAAALSGLVLAVFLTLLVKTQGIWRDGMAHLQLSACSRATRERMLHGINGQCGLRHASRAQLSCSTNRIAFSEISANATNTFILLLNANQPAAYSNAAGQRRLIQSGPFVDKASIATNGNILTIDLTLAMTNGWKKYTQPQRIRVYLLNQ